MPDMAESLPIQMVDLDKGKYRIKDHILSEHWTLPGSIVQSDLCISRESQVREVTEKLSELYPGSQIDLRVQFLEPTEDQKLADIHYITHR